MAAITAQIGRVLGPEGGWELVDNATWTAGVGLLEFLRDVGKHVTVNHMVAKESVKARMQGEHGISYTEFSYMLLQANDYWWLHANQGCELQVGGSDQWGNITAGIDLVRRRSAAVVHGLTWPLLLRSDGTKFGKSAAGESIWLAPERTSPYRFFQYWMQVDDADVERLLLQLTLVPVAEVHELAAQHAEAPGKRLAQRRLAAEVTALVHGDAAAADAEVASGVLFGAPLEAVPEGGAGRPGRRGAHRRRAPRRPRRGRRRGRPAGHGRPGGVEGRGPAGGRAGRRLREQPAPRRRRGGGPR